MQTIEVNDFTSGDACMSEKYWEQFMLSGKIEDYLNFAKMRQLETQHGDKREHAGAHLFDGNDIEAAPYRGVRQAYHPFDQGKG